MSNELLKGKTLEGWKEVMETNGYSYFDIDEFLKKSDKPCYIAENADEVSDIYSYVDMYNETLEFIKDNWGSIKDIESSRWDVEATLADIEKYTETVLNNFFDDISSRWTFYYTYLLSYFDI